MPRKIQVTYDKYPLTIAAMGDSLTYNALFSISPENFYPEVLAKSLRSLGCFVKARNFGISGNTTDQMIGRFAVMTQFEVPTIAVIWGGTNDTSGQVALLTLTSSGTTANVKTTAPHGLTTGRSVVVAGANQSSYNGTFTITVVDSLNFTYTMGGTGASPATGTITVNSAANDAQTQANLQTMITSLQNAGCTKIIVLSQHYLNLASGGDTTSVPYAPYAALRADQQAAVAATNTPTKQVVYCDQYAAERLRVVNNVEAAGAAALLISQSNSHLNALGESVCAAALLATIQNTLDSAGNAWIKNLQ